MSKSELQTTDGGMYTAGQTALFFLRTVRSSCDEPGLAREGVSVQHWDRVGLSIDSV